MTKRFSRGFTLIELLVVIAIIGILSSVILASLDTARGKGADAAVESNLDNMRAQAELVYDGASPNSYAGVCTNSTVSNALNAAESAGGASSIDTTFTDAGSSSIVSCHAASGTWLISAPLKSAEGSDNYWCVDNTGNSKGEAAAVSASQAACL